MPPYQLLNYFLEDYLESLYLGPHSPPHDLLTLWFPLAKQNIQLINRMKPYKYTIFQEPLSAEPPPEKQDPVIVADLTFYTDIHDALPFLSKLRHITRKITRKGVIEVWIPWIVLVNKQIFSQEELIPHTGIIFYKDPNNVFITSRFLRGQREDDMPQYNQVAWTY